MSKKEKITAVLIAFNAGKTLRNFYKDFPRDLVDEVILVDDASKDNTFEISKDLGILSYRNPVNLGYGGNMKKALSIALKGGADILIDIHPDGEYRASAIPPALREIAQGAKLVLGNRFNSIDKPLKSGMYLWKFIPIWLLNQFDRLILGVKANDLHQGFRVYTKDLLSRINFEENSNNYLFSFEVIAQAAFNHLRITQVPVETSYSGKKRGASLKNSIKYSLGTFKVLALFLMANAGLKTKLFNKPLEKMNQRLDKFLI